VDLLSSGRVRRVRRYAWLVAVGAVLAWPTTASAHSTAPTVALDFHLRISPATRALLGVRVDLVDGNRGLRLRVDPQETLIVRGDLGEPVVRFDSKGVWVNTHSVTAAADKLVKPSSSVSGVAWSLRTHGHTLRWHEHRLAPPVSMRRGVTGRWSVPILLNGSLRSVDGTFVRVAPPRWWLWGAGALALAAAIVVVAWRVPRSQPHLVLVLGALAAVGALASASSFALADEISGASEWVEVAAVGLLVGLAAFAIARRREGWRVWIGAAIGIVCATFSLGAIGVFAHGYVISTLPANLARISVLLAVVAGGATTALAITAEFDSERARAARAARLPTQPPPRPRARTR
jgi:hypothetical protein